uniref:ATP synthase complex subunit 8 n=1 Tax=Phyllotreta variipennis TaxID=1425530 RepID=A0A3G1GNU6_9CUCU|nr:ATP synthase F0 subunit 8 [Phyllotreta variipennis]
MPQMMPMNWLFLMLYFIFFYFLILVMNYYLINYQPKMINVKKSQLKYNWKW